MSHRPERGTYTLLIEVADSPSIAIGALGERDFTAGWYAYTGSALGPGGFTRIDRHRSVAAGENDTRHWHIDYLLGHPAASIDAVVRSPDTDIECTVSRAVVGERSSGFGASDCDCFSHLVGSDDRSELLQSIRSAHSHS